MRIVGTRSGTRSSTLDLFDELSEQGDVARVDVASAYWDEHAVRHARELARAGSGPLRLVLWTAGGSRPAWAAVRAVAAERWLDLRFVDSPEGGGIFHAKVAGAAGADGRWRCALVGSGNLTDAALRRNVELGVVIDDDPEAIAELQGWFERVFDAATPAREVDFDHALSIVPEQSEAASRSKLFRQAGLASPAAAGPALPAPAWLD
ncbi:MAG: PLD-like domain [Thermoleophilia bacterium]|nr:PLD-like domain [Thermoleophilia bacterium]